MVGRGDMSLSRLNTWATVGSTRFRMAGAQSAQSSTQYMMSAPSQRPAPSLLRSLLLLVTMSMSATRISPPGKQSSNRKQIRNCYKQLWVSRQFCEPLSCYGLHSGGRGTHTCDVRWLQTRAPLLSLASQGGVDGGFPALCCEERSFVGGIRGLSPESYRVQ